MQINIHDSSMAKIGYMNNDLPNSLHFYDDNWHRYLAEGTSTFDFKVSKVHPDSSLITSQGYVSFTYEGNDYLFMVMIKNEDDYILEVQCDSLNLELVNEQLNPYINNVEHTLDWYIWNAAGLSSNIIVIGNNPFTNTKILSFDQEETKLARLISIIQSWGGEFEFVTSLKNNGTLNELTLNIYQSKGLGEVRSDVTLYYGKNIVGITRTEDKTGIFNATTVTDSNGKYKWDNIQKTITNSDGNIEFYKNINEKTAYAPLSKDMFPSQIKSSSSDMYIRKDFKISAKSADDLWDYAYSQLKENAYPALTYEVTATSTAVRGEIGNGKRLNIGDTVTVYDDNFDKNDGGLILSARVSEQEISFSNPLNDKITFSNYVKLKSDISNELIDRMNDLINKNTPYRSEIEVSNGVQFKNNSGSTTITARVYFGSDISETIADSYSWSKDGNEVANAQSITIDGSSIIDKSVFVFTAKINDNIVASQSVTITNVNDGEQGLPGENGRSLQSISQKYQVTQTSIKPSDPWENNVWKTTQPTTTSENKYLWSITRMIFNQDPLTQDVIEQKAVYGDSGEPGANGNPGKVVSDTEPTIKFEGLTWKYIGVTAFNASDGTSIQSSTEYYWNGKNWVINLINAHNIKVDDLSAISATFTDGKIENNWVSGTIAGQTVIEDNHFLINSKDSANNDLNTIALDNQQGFAMNYTSGSTGALRGVYLNFQGLTFSDDSGKNYIAISSSGLNLSRNVPWTITGAFTINPVTSNFNSSNFPNVSMYKYGNIVYMHFVTTNSIAVSLDGNIGSIPSGCIPSVQWHVTLEANTGVTYRATVNTDGLMRATTAIPANTPFRCTVTYPI